MLRQYFCETAFCSSVSLKPAGWQLGDPQERLSHLKIGSSVYDQKTSLVEPLRNLVFSLCDVFHTTWPYALNCSAMYLRQCRYLSSNGFNLTILLFFIYFCIFVLLCLHYYLYCICCEVVCFGYVFGLCILSC